nr:hypothetical protein [Tanacetum cinerariifolium]
MLDHQDKYMMKAQVHVLKSSAISDIQPLPRRKHYCQIYQVVKHMLRGRLLARFQDLEYEGGDTRSQGGIKDNDSKIKIQDHSMQMITQMNSQEQGSKFQERLSLNDHPLGGDLMEMIRLSLGLHVNQSPCGIFINQSKYVLEILNKYGIESCDPVDIVHATCLCARYQAKPTEKHLKEVKKIFRYLWGTVNTSLWYTKDSGFELTGFSDADYAGCKHTFKSTSGEAQFLGEKLAC